MKKYLLDLFVENFKAKHDAPAWILRLYLSLFSPPLGKTLRLDMVREVLQGYQFNGKRILDVGCGIGDLSFMLAARGAEVVGIELDEQKVRCATDIACRWNFEQLRFVAGDVTSLDQMELGQFDVITCLALLEHIQQDVELLQQLQQLLRPGGLLVLEVPSATRKTIPEVEAADGHVRSGYRIEELPVLLKQAGFWVKRKRTMDPLGLNYYWFVTSRLMRSEKARPWFFAALGPLFLTLIRLSSVCIKRPGAELCFLAVADAVPSPVLSRSGVTQWEEVSAALIPSNT
jgi:ubiquinone/menaquinone biosynthesis C-methylase UbiE